MEGGAGSVAGGHRECKEATFPFLFPCYFVG